MHLICVSQWWFLTDLRPCEKLMTISYDFLVWKRGKAAVNSQLRFFFTELTLSSIHWAILQLHAGTNVEIRDFVGRPRCFWWFWYNRQLRPFGTAVNIYYRGDCLLQEPSRPGQSSSELNGFRCRKEKSNSKSESELFSIDWLIDLEGWHHMLHNM